MEAPTTNIHGSNQSGDVASASKLSGISCRTYAGSAAKSDITGRYGVIILFDFDAI